MPKSSAKERINSLPPHLYYEYAYTVFDADSGEHSYQRKSIFFPSRNLMIRDTGYSMNCLALQQPNAVSGIRWFKLGIDSCPPNFVGSAYEDVLTLIFIVGGAGTAYGKAVGVGDVFYTPPLVPQVTCSDAENPWVQVWIQVSGGYENYLLEQFKQLSSKPFLRCKDVEKVRKLAEYLIFEQDCPENIYDYFKSILSMFLSFITPPENADGGSEARQFERHESLIQNACDYIGRHLATVTVTELADLYHFNKRYFSEIFKSVTGTFPQAYIIERKLSWVQFFLVESDMTLEQIMDSVGYTHRNGLVSAFKKRFGCTPASYRKAKRK